MKTLFAAAAIAMMTAFAPASAAGDGPGRDSDPADRGIVLASGDHDYRGSWYGYDRHRGPHYPYWFYRPFRYFHHYDHGYSGYGGGYGYHGKPHRYDHLSAHGLREWLHRHHYSRVGHFDWDDGYYRVKAIDPYGRRVKLFIDPYSGEIIGHRYY